MKGVVGNVPIHRERESLNNNYSRHYVDVFLMVGHTLMFQLFCCIIV